MNAESFLSKLHYCLERQGGKLARLHNKQVIVCRNINRIVNSHTTRKNSRRLSYWLNQHRKHSAQIGKTLTPKIL